MDPPGPPPPEEDLSSVSGRGSGGLLICGCRWRIGSDDLVFPAWIEVLFRLMGLAILIGVLAYEEVTSFSCAAEYHLNVYLMVAIAIFSLTIVNLVLLGINSAKGYIWDAGMIAGSPNPRRFVTPLVYMNIFLTFSEFLWALIGNIWVVKGLLSQCIKPGDVKITDIPLYAILGIIVTTWIGLILKVILSCLSFNSIESRDSQGNNEPFVMQQNRSMISKIFSKCCKPTTSNVFQEVATVLADVFDDRNFVPTDIAAALLLLYARQSDRAEGIMLPGSAANMERGPPTKRREMSPEDKPFDHPEYVRTFIQYAGAAYGYTWFLMRHTSRRVLKMSPYLKCCACCACCHEQGMVEADNCIGCNTAALKTMLPNLPEENIVHISFKNQLMEVPYFVAADDLHKKIIVSIRGTLSLSDALTDLCAQPGSMDQLGPALKDYIAHCGMLKAAKYVYSELMEKHILDKAFSHFNDGYELVITGHSLGAGTAVILSFMLQEKFPNVKCYAYSPPGGLLCEEAAKASEDFCVSVIVGQDLVPRLSFQSVMLLKENMKKLLRSCKLPKYQILGSGICSPCIKDWKKRLHHQTRDSHREEPSAGGDNASDQELMSPASTGSEESAVSSDPIIASSEHDENPNQGYQSMSTIQAAKRPSTTSIMNNSPKMILPGRIWHVEQNLDSEFRSTLQVNIRRPDEFQEIIVSPKMLTDHFPNNVCDMLALIKDQDMISAIPNMSLRSAP